MAKPFFDTNVLLYLFSADLTKAEQARAVVRDGGVISVQVLNEFAAVARRKLGMSWSDIRLAVERLASLCDVHPLTLETHCEAVRLAERHGWHIYDALIVSSAKLADAEILYSEDLQAGQRVGRRLQIRNPF